MNNNTYTTFYIVRHGETEWNRDGRLQGQKDSPLTEKGLAQAKVVAQKLRHIKFDALFSSDLLRAKRTADIIALEHELAVDTTEALRERKFGTVEGKKPEELRRELKEIMEVFDSLPPEERFRYRFVEDMESDDEVATRFITYLREMAVAYIGKTVLLVCHGGLMRAFLIKVGYGTHEELPPGTIDNTAYFRLDSDGVEFFVKETDGIHKRNAA
jgi:broad specificity phosphatase PhoE